MANSFSTLAIDSREGVLKITLDRPDGFNAFNSEMGVELSAALRMAQRDDAVRCVVLTGRGPAFCSGQDIRDLRAAAEAAAGGPALELGAYVRDTVNPIVLRMRTMEKPIVAAVNGVAAGVGISFALASDLRICAASARFRLGFAQVGLVPDGGATQTLIQQLGYARASELCLLNEDISAAQAVEMGLVSRAVRDEELENATRKLTEQLKAQPARALGLAKRALRAAWTNTLEEQLAYEAWLQATASQTIDHIEGVAAFLEKRPPAFTGK